MPHFLGKQYAMQIEYCVYSISLLTKQICLDIEWNTFVYISKSKQYQIPFSVTHSYQIAFCVPNFRQCTQIEDADRLCLGDSVSYIAVRIDGDDMFLCCRTSCLEQGVKSLL